MFPKQFLETLISLENFELCIDNYIRKWGKTKKLLIIVFGIFQVFRNSFEFIILKFQLILINFQIFDEFFERFGINLGKGQVFVS